eukprot:CAMPEP_0184491842 /NCGR_PEP_ID=MMETSP0113_2-20130426/21496_1 /TAXON_ID=91329 /ORGANISM="Norrisiella sphaerica, Strain BC52" /LENGTH=554 /DNA_ID=CAMNT_0026876383 /DNA_START=262 /DNA_END=1926 /DNA_ORIENTATION=-
MNRNFKPREKSFSPGQDLGADAMAESVWGTPFDRQLGHVPASATSVDMVEKELAKDLEAVNSADKEISKPSTIRKINTDLLLFRARLERRNFRKQPDGSIREQSSLFSEKVFRRCLSMAPMDGRAYVGLGTLLMNQKRVTEAEELYEEGTRMTQGSNPYIWTAWANLESRRGKLTKARKLYEGAVVAKSSHSAAWHGWGLLEMRQGNLRRAAELFEKGIRNTVGDANPYLYQSLGYVLEKMGKIEEARRTYLRGTKESIVSKSDALWHTWAKMESKHGNDDVVRYLYQRALAVNPKSRYTHLSWGVWEKEQGNHESARELFKKGHKLNPRDAAILQAWALLEYEMGLVERARELLKQGTEADNKHIPVWQAWGVLEYLEGNYKKARDLFQQGVWAGPNSRDVSKVFQAWAVLEKKERQYNLARTLFSCAVKADPKSEASWLAWAQMEEDLGLNDRAEELRNYNQAEQNKRGIDSSLGSIIVGPDSMLSPIFRGVQAWIQQFSERGPRRGKNGPPRRGAAASLAGKMEDSDKDLDAEFSKFQNDIGLNATNPKSA